MSRRHPRTLVAAAAAVALLAACGGDDDDAATDPAATDPAADGTDTGGDAGAVTVVAEDIDFGAASYETSPGTVSFEYVNEGSIEHTLVIEGVDDFGLRVESRGDIDQGSVELEAGSYRLYCDIPGHAQAGMEADLEVS